MTYSLTNKNSNGIPESPHVEQQGEKIPSADSVETDVENSGLPANFGEVVRGVYRCSFPQPCNLPALKILGLKTIITLVEETYTQSHMSFLKESGITHHRITFIANKDAAVKTPESVVNHIMEIILNKSNHPILIHCNKGKHRTGCVTGCFRKLQGWTMRDIVREYVQYSFPKQRPLDEAFIQAFDPSKLSHLAQASGANLWHPTGIDFNAQHKKDQKTSKRLLQPSCNGIRVT